MSLDLEKLTPAPWESRHVLGEVVGEWSDAMNRRLQVCVRDRTTPSSEADFDFIALARNAFDVMMRRGWMVCREVVTSNPSHKAYGRSVWTVRSEHHGDLIGPIGSRIIWADDPFTALVEADKWHVENIERKAVEP